MWSHLPTNIIRRRMLRFAASSSIVVALITTLVFASISQAAPGINQTINFQGRLLNASGATVPDGYYNIQFKIYQDGAGTAAGNPGGTLEWTETYINNNSATGAVQVKNGFFAVNLGSLNPFGTQVDWNQDTLWLSMNVAGSAVACTSFGTSPCTADGEMLPMRRMTSSPYALNSGQLEGKSASNFVQLAQGVQTDASSNTSSIFINKTSTGNLVQLQNAGADIFTVTNAGDLTFGNNANHTISIATSAASTVGRNLTMSAGTGGSGTGSAGGNLVLQGGAAGGTNGSGGSVTINGGARTGTGTAGAINIGTANAANTIQIGSTTLNAGTQTINIGNNNTAGGTTNVTIGAGSSATGGTTSIQSKGDTTFTTNGTARARFSGSGNTLYVGNANSSGQATTASAFTIQGTSSTGSNVQGGTLTLQSGSATSGNANGGNLVLSGGNGVGTGSTGLVVINTPTFQTTTNDANCYTGGALVAGSCTFTVASVNGTASIIAGFSTGGQVATLPDPTITTAGRVIYVTAANNSEDFTLRANTGGGLGIEQNIAMRKNTSATMIWNGSDWTAAGASSSTTLQSAYDNTLQSAGGAELVVSKTSATNGLTIRESSTNPVDGALFSVQNASAANLITINSNVTEYTSNSGAEQYSGTTTFPANTWVALTGATVSRNITTNNIATGQGSAQVNTTTTAGSGVKNVLSSSLTADQHYNVSFTAKLSSGTFTNMGVYYSVDGSADSVACITNQAIKTSVWTKVNCTFTAPSTGITANNSINIRQTGSGTARTFYVDNISVTIAADFNYATDGTVNDDLNFAANWLTAGLGTATVTRNTTDGQEASDSARVAISAGAANAGLRNNLSINPLPSTLYRISVYAKQSSGAAFTDFKVRYSRNNGTNFVDCVDYNTQTVTTTDWTQITCYITTDATTATDPYVYFVESSSAVRTYMVDSFSMTLASNTTPNIQIGGGINGGPTTLFTLDKGASAPIAANNDALLGSMYYDTTLGKLQCYEADGWGACGSSPDNIVTISPEYTNSVMHGTGVGTMTSDLCSGFLNINDPTNGPQICDESETYNFYKWTSPQPTTQAYSIYVTYQLPSTFKAFTSGSTSIQARVDNTTNAFVKLQIYKNSGGLVACGNDNTITTSANTWQAPIASGTADPSTCGFAPGDSIVFKITMSAEDNANAYIGNLGFAFTNK